MGIQPLKDICKINRVRQAKKNKDSKLHVDLPVLRDGQPRWRKFGGRHTWIRSDQIMQFQAEKRGSFQLCGFFWFAHLTGRQTMIETQREISWKLNRQLRKVKNIPVMGPIQCNQRKAKALRKHSILRSSNDNALQIKKCTQLEKSKRDNL